MAKIRETIVRKYARALFESYSTSEVPAVALALTRVVRIWEDSKDLRESMRSPLIPLQLQRELAGDVAETVRPKDAQFLNFLNLLVENHRFACLPELAQAFTNLLNQLKKVLVLEITTAFEISEGEREQIAQSLRKDLSPQVSVKWNVEPNILGGLQILSGDKLFDSSVRGSLERIRAELVR